MMILKHKFVDKIPEIIEEGTIYISIPYETIIHKCCCGCGNEVVTPLSPSQWKLIFDGESVSLDPSIGNWSLECRSHYYIKNNNVIWARTYDEREIEEVRKYDSEDNRQHFKKSKNKSKKKSLWKAFISKILSF